MIEQRTLCFWGYSSGLPSWQHQLQRSVKTGQRFCLQVASWSRLASIWMTVPLNSSEPVNGAIAFTGISTVSEQTALIIVMQ